MAFQQVLALLCVALCLNLQSASGKVPTTFKRVSCKDTETWPHAYRFPDHPDGHADSSATVQCLHNSVLLTVNSPAKATRVSFQVLDENFNPLGRNANSKCSKVYTDLYVATATPIDAGVPVGNEALPWSEWDDYYDQAKLRSADSSKVAKNDPVGFATTLEYGYNECGAEESIQMGNSPLQRASGDVVYNHGFSRVLVEEHLYVNGVVHLVSRTILFISCEVSANQPQPDVVVPDVKQEHAEVCDETSYSLSASVVGEEYQVTVQSLSHPALEHGLGFFIDTLDYSGESIIDAGGNPSALQAVIKTTLSPPKCSDTRYDVRTDVVVVPGVAPEVLVSATVKYCYNGIGVTDCPVRKVHTAAQ